MPGSFAEMNKKVSISIGALIFIIALTFTAATFYIETRSLREDLQYEVDKRGNTIRILEERMDKRYGRIQEQLDELKAMIEENSEGIRELEKCHH